VPLKLFHPSTVHVGRAQLVKYWLPDRDMSRFYASCYTQCRAASERICVYVDTVRVHH